MRPGDFQNVGAVFRQGPAAGRPGQDPRKVQDPHTGQRSVARGQRFGGAVSDLDNLQKGERGNGGGLGVLGPFVHGPHHAPGAIGRDDCLLQLLGVPTGHRLPHRLLVFGNAEHLQCGGAVVREIAVQVTPTTVPGRVDTHDRVAFGRNVVFFELHVTPAAKRGGCPPYVHSDLLTSPGARFPDVRDGEADGPKRGGAGFGNAKGRGQERVFSVGKFQVFQPFLLPFRDRT